MGSVITVYRHAGQLGFVTTEKGELATYESVEEAEDDIKNVPLLSHFAAPYQIIEVDI